MTHTSMSHGTWINPPIVEAAPAYTPLPRPYCPEDTRIASAMESRVKRTALDSGHSAGPSGGWRNAVIDA